MKGMKQGPWVVHIEPLRGEPGFEEEGSFMNDKKEGTWRRFNLMGDLMAIENYKWGNKNGKCQYFTIAGLEHEESWKALNPNKMYDTIDVPDVKNPDQYEKVVVKVEASSLKHGQWKYYNPTYGSLLRTETYLLDNLQTGAPEELNKPLSHSTVDSIAAPTAKPAEKPKPKEVQDFEKKNKGKKKITVRDGKTG